MKSRCVLASVAAIAAAAGMAQGQQIVESFDDITTLAGNGWSLQNLCDVPIDAIGWFQGNDLVFPANTGTTQYIGSNYNRTSGTLNNCWLILPQRTLNNGDTLVFFARAIDAGFPDRLQVRMSTAGASTNAGPGLGSIDPGDFTNLLLDINPSLLPGVFVNAWTQYTVTVSGLAGPTSGRLAFRYFVENGGPTGLVSDYIGIDDVTYTPAGSGGGPVCYANCDSSTNIPCLNVQDFGCFLNAFSNGESYANCDGSTNIPVLNVQDFGCFLNAFSAGCSACV